MTFKSLDQVARPSLQVRKTVINIQSQNTHNMAKSQYKSYIPENEHVCSSANYHKT